MTKMGYRARARNLRRILWLLVALLCLLSVGVVIAIATRPQMTVAVTIASIAAALVIALLAVALRIAFRNLPELEQLTAKIDEEAAADGDGQEPEPE